MVIPKSMLLSAAVSEKNYACIRAVDITVSFIVFEANNFIDNVYSTWDLNISKFGMSQ